MNAPRPAGFAFAPSPCGGLAAAVAGTRVVLRPSGALWAPGLRLLAVADLHLEKGSAYAARGQLLPPYDTRDTLRRLAAEAAALDPATILFLGDTLHDPGAGARIDAADAGALRALAQGRALVWVVGNHDPDGPGDLPGEPCEVWRAGGLTFRHEPTPGPAPGEAAGHLHPCARVSGRGRSVRRRCFVTDGERIVLPAFGAYAGGLNVRDPAFASLFARPPLVGALGSRRVHAVGYGSVVGD